MTKRKLELKPKPQKMPVDPKAMVELGRAQAWADVHIGVKLFVDKYVSPSKTYSGVHVYQMFELLVDKIKNRRF